MRRAGFLLLLLSTGCYRVSFDVVGDRALIQSIRPFAGDSSQGVGERVVDESMPHWMRQPL